MTTRKGYGKVSQKWILATVNSLIPRLGLDKWHVDVEFSAKKSANFCMMDLAPVLKGYSQGLLTVYTETFAEYPMAARIKALIHELRHLHYAELDATIFEQVGADSKVAKALDREVEKLCDADAQYFYRKFYTRRRKNGD